MSKTMHCDKPGLMPIEEGKERLLEAARIFPAIESKASSLCANHVLAEEIVSQVNVPPADNSAVDGYAINLDCWQDKKSYKVSQRIPAGTNPDTLETGSCARIFTGASVPTGANAVIMQENSDVNSDGSVTFSTKPTANQNIRPAAQDIAIGQAVLIKGQVLNAQRLGLIASIGITHATVYRPLKVGIMSTGDELIEPGNALAAGQIYNSNRPMLKALVEQLNMEILDFGIVEDSLEATKTALNEASRKVDVIITTGGASVGEEDHIQDAIKAEGSLDFWRLAIKPGKPFMLGEINETPILGLPGNPGAVLVTFLVLAKPFLLKCQGIETDYSESQSFRLPLGFDVKKPRGRQEYLRVKIDERGTLQQHPNQSSGVLSSASWGHGLAVIPIGVSLSEGELVDYFPFTSLCNLPS